MARFLSSGVSSLSRRKIRVGPIRFARGTLPWACPVAHTIRLVRARSGHPVCHTCGALSCGPYDSSCPDVTHVTQDRVSHVCGRADRDGDSSNTRSGRLLSLLFSDALRRLLGRASTPQTKLATGSSVYGPLFSVPVLHTTSVQGSGPLFGFRSYTDPL